MANKSGYVRRWLIWPKGGKENLGIEFSLTLEMEATYSPKHKKYSALVRIAATQKPYQN
jgi:hypothetical protein